MASVQEAAELLVAAKIDEARAICEEIVAKDDNEVGAFYLLALIYNTLALKQNQPDFFKKAIDACDKAIEKGAGVAEIYMEKARALQELGDQENAMIAAAKAVELNPELGKEPAV